MNYYVYDYQIRDLIGVARHLLKQRRDWLERFGDCSIFDKVYAECPAFMPYLKLKYIIRDMMQARRKNRKTQTEIWSAYADYCIELRNKNVG